MSNTILVTGATGNIAGLVIPDLIKSGANVRAYVRNPEKAQSLKEMGVELFEGDFDNQEALNNAASGVDAILAITPPNALAVEQGRAILTAAKKAGNPYIVRISAIGAAHDAPTENGRLHIVSDEELIASGLPYTILRPHFFMQNLFGVVDTIKGDGNMYMGMADGKVGIIDVRDIADCAVSLLVDRGHDNKVFTPTGPASISFYDMAKMMGEGLGKDVNYIPVSIEAVGDALRPSWGEWGAKLMMEYSKAYAEGWGDFTNEDVKTITGNEARDFSSFVNEVYAWAFKG